MRNPLNKRFIRELRSGFGKYLVIFLFMVATIGFVSGYLVANYSMTTAYDESFEKCNIEDGHFTLADKMSSNLKDEIETDRHIKIYKNFYKETDYKKATYRVFVNRTKVNLASVLEGRLANKDNEIAVDRMFADNNGIKVGDYIKLSGNKLKVCGLIAFSDYSALFKDNTDTMFDAQNFTVAAVTADCFDKISDNHLNYQYSYTFNNTSLTDTQKYNRSEDLLDYIVEKTVVTDFLTEQDNQAIHFTGDDMGSDSSMMQWLLYIVIVIMAFVFCVTISNTVEQESTVIGTLRASGYTKAEMTAHYILLPVIVTLVAAIIGNILGYTVFKEVVVSMYYNSYSLGVYETLWSGYAFVITTVVPCLIMLVVNLVVIRRKMSLSPLQFLRRELKKKNKSHVISLPNFRFINRFRLRVILQNKSGYAVLFVGVLFANVILLFGVMMHPLLDNFKAEIVDNMICDYQYILKAPVDTQSKQAEKFAVTSLDTTFDGDVLNQEVSVYGIAKNSDYIDLSFENDGENTIYVADGMIEKYGLSVGDKITLKEAYGSEKYTFKIAGSYYYPSGFAVFTDIKTYRDIFDCEKGYFNGYFSDKKLSDIDDDYIATVIEQDDMTTVSDQLDRSMGEIFNLVTAFAVLMYMLLVYLLSKLIIEKNSKSISIIKILGYKNSEILSVYIVSTAVMTLLSILISVPISYLIIGIVFRMIFNSYLGWFPYYVSSATLIEMVIIGIVAYAILGYFQYRKIKHIPMGEALKNTE